VPYILHNETNSVVALELSPSFDTTGMPQWKLRQNTRGLTKWVKIAPASMVDLCGPPWNLSEKEAEDQVSVKTHIRKGHLRRIGSDGNYIPTEAIVNVSDVQSIMPPSHGIPVESRYEPDESQYDSLTPQTGGEPGSDRFIKLEDLEPAPGSNPVLKPEEPTNPSIPRLKTINCSEGVHSFPSDGQPCLGCGVLKSMICGGCGWVGKNARAVTMHKKSVHGVAK
jgi:hypothetical protein